MRAAQQWYDCTPEVKQPDWLHGVDIIAVPMTPGAGKRKWSISCRKIQSLG
jgi:hypothetical protein